MRHQNNFTGRILFMSMFNDISVDQKTMKKNAWSNAKLASLYAIRFGKGQWSLIGPGSEKKWYCITEDSPQGVWDNIVERMLVEFAESGCPIFRATSPLSRGQLKSKGHGNCRYTMQPTRKRLRLFFAQLFLQTSSVFTEQSRRYLKSMKPFTRERRDPL